MLPLQQLQIASFLDVANGCVGKLVGFGGRFGSEGWESRAVVDDLSLPDGISVLFAPVAGSRFIFPRPRVSARRNSLAFSQHLMGDLSPNR